VAQKREQLATVSERYRYTIAGKLAEYRPIITGATLASAGISCRLVPVCPSVSLSQVSVVLKRLNVGSRKERQTIAQEL